jgi:hypothetical protein
MQQGKIFAYIPTFIVVQTSDGRWQHSHFIRTTKYEIEFLTVHETSLLKSLDCFASNSL